MYTYNTYVYVPISPKTKPPRQESALRLPNNDRGRRLRHTAGTPPPGGVDADSAIAATPYRA